MARFSAAQQRVIDAANLAMASGVNSPGPMSAILEEIFAAIAAGAFGITADPLDIDRTSLSARRWGEAPPLPTSDCSAGG